MCFFFNWTYTSDIVYFYSARESSPAACSLCRGSSFMPTNGPDVVLAMRLRPNGLLGCLRWGCEPGWKEVNDDQRPRRKLNSAWKGFGQALGWYSCTCFCCGAIPKSCCICFCCDEACPLVSTVADSFGVASVDGFRRRLSKLYEKMWKTGF